MPQLQVGAGAGEKGVALKVECEDFLEGNKKGWGTPASIAEESPLGTSFSTERFIRSVHEFTSLVEFTYSSIHAFIRSRFS